MLQFIGLIRDITQVSTKTSQTLQSQDRLPPSCACHKYYNRQSAGRGSSSRDRAAPETRTCSPALSLPAVRCHSAGSSAHPSAGLSRHRDSVCYCLILPDPTLIGTPGGGACPVLRRHDERRLQTEEVGCAGVRRSHTWLHPGVPEVRRMTRGGLRCFAPTMQDDEARFDLQSVVASSLSTYHV